MTILNLNGPTGRAPRGKKTVRAWMGVGLVIAVLGIGSTFAANIAITNGNASEFGQGVTKTVYCGAGEDEITITPVSAFVPESSSYNAGRAGVPSSWIAPTYSGRSFVKVSSSYALGEGTYVNDLSGASETRVPGYWVSSRVSSNPSYSTNGNSSGTYSVFAPRVREGSDYGFYKYSSWNPGSWTIAVASIAPRTTIIPSNFEVKGITVSDIDGDCDGRDFILSAYNNSNAALTFVDVYPEIAVLYDKDAAPQSALVFSFDRANAGVPSNKGDLATVTAGSKKFTITFTGSGRIDTDDLKNIVIETQDDLLDPSSGDNDEDED